MRPIGWLTLGFLVLMFAIPLVGAYRDVSAQPHAIIPLKDWNAIIDKMGCASEDRGIFGEPVEYAVMKLTTCVANRIDRLDRRVKALERTK